MTEPESQRRPRVTSRGRGVATLAALLLLATASAAPAPQANTTTHWQLLRPTKMTSAGGATLTLDPEGAILVGGANPERDTFTFECLVERNGLTGFRVEALSDPTLPASGPGRSPNGNFVLNEFKVEQAPTNSDGWKPVLLERPSADFEQQGFGVQNAIDGAAATGWAIAPELGVPHQAVFEAQRDVGFEAGVKLKFTLEFQFGAQHVMGRIRLACTDSSRPLKAPRDDHTMGEAQGKIAPAIARGVRWLLDQQELDGLWAYRAEDVKYGMTSLAGYTLLKCGIAPTHPAIARAAARIRCEPAGSVYAAGLELLFLSELPGDDLQPRIEETTSRLLSWQIASGGFSYPGGAADLSNGQYAALGLRAAAKHGVKIAPEVWIKLAEETLLHQEKGSGAYGSAGFGYAAGSAPYGSVTAGGTCVLKICDDQLAKSGASRTAFGAAWRKGLAWLDRSFAPDTNPGVGTWVWYWLYGIERVGGLCEVDELAGKSWYRFGAKFIVENQKPEGFWDGDGGPQPSTCFALLFLARATSSVSGVTVRSENLYGGDDPAADVSLRASGDTPLTLWVSSLGGAAAALGWPQESGGPHVSKVVYTVPGRTLLADARDDAGKWRFATEAPAAGFEQPGFDDAKWKSAPGAFGAKGTSGIPVRTEWTSPELWLRRELLLDDSLRVDGAPLLDPQLFVAIAPLATTPVTRPDLVCLFDEQRDFPGQVNEASAGGSIALRETGAWNGGCCLAVQPQQAFRAAMPGWGYSIAEKPEPGQYRYLRLAWRKENGGGIMVQLAHNGGWDAATARIHSGPNEFKWNSVEIERDSPRDWRLATVDLWRAFGSNTTFTGIAFTPMSGGAGLYDAIYLARALDDFEAIPRSPLALEAAAKVPGAVAPAGAPPAATASGDGAAQDAGFVELFVNGTKVFACEQSQPEYEPVATLAPLTGLLKPGRNVVAVHALKGAAVAAVDLALRDQRVLATIAGKPDQPTGIERYAAQINFDRNGLYALRALVHVVPPPELSAGGEVTLLSRELVVPIREALDTELISYGSDAGRNLLALNGAVASASSSFDASFMPERAIDNLASRGWLSADGDRRPHLAIELKKPARADTILLTPIQSRGMDAERTHWRVRRVEVQVDQGKGGTFEIVLPADFRKGVVRLPKVAVVRRLDIRILDASNVPPIKNALGLGEVELQLRK